MVWSRRILIYGAALCILSVWVLWVFCSSDVSLRTVHPQDSHSLVTLQQGELQKNSLLDSTSDLISEPQQSVDKSIASRELDVFLETLRSKGIQNNGADYDKRYKVLRNYSETQIGNFVADFGVPNLNSIPLNRQLLVCAGLTLAKQFVNITSDGNVVMPKHFQKCKSMSFQKNRKTVALLSFPGSGNSWVRQLLETTTGIYTGTYKDCDISYIANGMIGEGVYTDNVIAVKIHFVTKGEVPWFHGHDVIYVVRNPFNAILAEWKRITSFLRNKTSETHLSNSATFGKYFYCIN